jgi:hypothetical protein
MNLAFRRGCDAFIDINREARCFFNIEPLAPF